MSGTRFTDNTSKNRDKSSPRRNWNTKIHTCVWAWDTSSIKNVSPSAKNKKDSKTPSKVQERRHSGQNIETATGQVERQIKMPAKLAHMNLESQSEEGEDMILLEPIPFLPFDLSGHEITGKWEELEMKNGTILGSQGNSLVFPAVQALTGNEIGGTFIPETSEVEVAVENNERSLWGKGETGETSEPPPDALDRVCQEVGELLVGLHVEIPSKRVPVASGLVRDTGESTAQENNCMAQDKELLRVLDAQREGMALTTITNAAIQVHFHI